MTSLTFTYLYLPAMGMGVTEPREPAADRSRILPATAEEPAIDKDGSGIGGGGGRCGPPPVLQR